MPGQVESCSEPCLALSTSVDAAEDGFLTMSEIFGLRLDAALIVLSACNTGVVDVALPNLEALSGFARAFFHAGARRLLLTLWSISDTATAEFMSSFYAHLLRADRPLEALWEARRRMLSIPGLAHPFFWAPFVLIGE
ncbi:MAG: CHAT domain protein [bacterium ADurb.Bin374]|nr:MAG: CHAT domain protein [bacterium ADurb.Bin374]